MITETEIKVFPPNQRKAELEISAVIASKAVNVLAERLGVEAGKAAEKALKTMKQQDMDFVQFRVADKRVRIRQTAQ